MPEDDSILVSRDAVLLLAGAFMMSLSMDSPVVKDRAILAAVRALGLEDMDLGAWTEVFRGQVAEARGRPGRA